MCLLVYCQTSHQCETVEATSLVGETEGRYFADHYDRDRCDAMRCCEITQENGARSVVAAVSHGVLNGLQAIS